MEKIKNTVYGLISSLFIISAAVILGLNFRPLYYMNIQRIQLLNESYSGSQIKNNYDILIDYLNPFYNGKLVLDRLPMSTFGEFHFYEVKMIFNLVYLLLGATFILGIIIFFVQYRKRDFKYLKIASILTFVIPVLLGIPFIVDFNKAFVAFHEIAFSNDYWLFDPRIDPVINILPEWFFMYAAFLILIIMIILAAMAFFTGKFLSRKNQKTI
ncbi:MAG: TIGR01906 family membrane protein [Clostridiaceae bacterium]